MNSRRKNLNLRVCFPDSCTITYSNTKGSYGCLYFLTCWSIHFMSILCICELTPGACPVLGIYTSYTSQAPLVSQSVTRHHWRDPLPHVPKVCAFCVTTKFVSKIFKNKHLCQDGILSRSIIIASSHSEAILSECLLKGQDMSGCVCLIYLYECAERKRNQKEQIRNRNAVPAIASLFATFYNRTKEVLRFVGSIILPKFCLPSIHLINFCGGAGTSIP